MDPYLLFLLHSINRLCWQHGPSPFFRSLPSSISVPSILYTVITSQECYHGFRDIAKWNDLVVERRGGSVLSQQEWIQIWSLYQELNWMDWLSFIVSVVSPIIMVISVIIAWKATKIAKESTELNLKMYQKQIDDLAKSFWPVFEVQTIQASSDIVRIILNNKGNNPISVTNIAYTESIEHFEEVRPSDNDIKMKFLGEFKEHDQIKIWLYYITLNHKYYSSEIILRIVEGSIVIENHIIKDRN